MKKELFSVAALALAAIMLASSLAACGGNADSDSGSSAAEGVVTTASEVAATTSAEASDKSSSSDSSESSEAGDSDAAELDGTYAFVEMKSNGKDNTEQVERLKSMGLPTDLVFDGDKANLMGIEYAVKDGKLIDAEDELSFTVDGNRITVVDQESEMTFEKQ